MSNEPAGDGQVPLEAGEEPAALPEEQVLGLLYPKPEEPEGEPETDAEAEQEQPEAAPDSVDSNPEMTAEDEGPAVSNLTELAEAVEVDTAFLYGLEVPMGDGLKPMTIGELKDAATHISRSNAELEREKVAVEAMREKVSYDEEINELVTRLKLSREAFEQAAAYRNEYAKKDAGAVALAVQEFNERIKKMEDEIEQKKLEYQEKASEREEQYKAHERTLLRDKIPEWKDADVVRKDLEAIWSLAGEYGFTPQELGNLVDHRAIMVLRDLAKVKDRIAAARGVPKTVKKMKLPKRLKSVTKTESTDAADQRRLQEKARETGNIRDQVAAVTSLLTGER